MASTVAPTTTAPELSVTMPLMDAADCADTDAAHARHTITTPAAVRLIASGSPGQVRGSLLKGVILRTEDFMNSW
jgi:hypothetical protein